MKPSKKIEKYLLSFIILFIAHSIEEYLAGFYNVHPYFKLLVQNIGTPSLEIKGIIFILAMLALLIILFLRFKKGNGKIGVPVFFCALGLYELEHIIRALLIKAYYPGAIAAFPLFILGILIFRDLIMLRKKKET